MATNQNISASCFVFFGLILLSEVEWVKTCLSYSFGYRHIFESDCNLVLFSILISIWGRTLYENCPTSFAHIAFDNPLSNGHSGAQFSGPSLTFLVKSKFLFELGGFICAANHPGKSSEPNIINLHLGLDLDVGLNLGICFLFWSLSWYWSWFLSLISVFIAVLVLEFVLGVYPTKPNTFWTF